MSIKSRSISFSVLFVASIASAALCGCDDPCADLEDRCDECEGSDEDLCTRLVDNYDYEACEDALDTDICLAPAAGDESE